MYGLEHLVLIINLWLEYAFSNVLSPIVYINNAGNGDKDFCARSGHVI